MLHFRLAIRALRARPRLCRRHFVAHARHWGEHRGVLDRQCGPAEAASLPGPGSDRPSGLYVLRRICALRIGNEAECVEGAASLMARRRRFTLAARHPERECARGTSARASNQQRLLHTVWRSGGAWAVFTAAEDRPGGTRVALLSDGFWRRRFGSDPSSSEGSSVSMER